MNHNLPLPQSKKLVVTYRVEPGCLGPEGKNHVDSFCQLAEKGVASVDSDFIHWHITPRHDKNLAEMHYSVNGKELNHDMADKYLNVFGKNLDEFEGHLHENLALIIDFYWKR